ncbi:hypothetical protein Deipr_2515 (plasmid) [Deinococcus proteolyticus MRP]|uniref:Uncharacterized protein n=1 Tax=Deinococcus proteolyticus (strain ATCC 35074 / DSM 20540 / JCM 6276 / NBRC 101906 / NCIMB 13154 / VKM Ac-1939 / CCM 2703 / MRP) TaxID=693977 RepID=F0RQS3_DEIPM|nr:hypothetical protein [Deinococcus proteolyticus]ADY27632.1 hypothetical protein Deipr_2515 [Deinococcus proteolyticus MRP]
MSELHTTLIGRNRWELSLGASRLKQVGLAAGAQYLLGDAPAAVRTALDAQDVDEFPVLLHGPTQAVLSLRWVTERELQAWAAG